MSDFIKTKDEVIKNYSSNVQTGLSDKQAKENIEKFGTNSLTKKKADSLLKRIWDASTEPMLLMLIAAGLIALAVNIIRSFTGGKADYLECVGVFAAIALSVVISVVMEGRSAKAFDALSKINSNVIVKAVREGKTVKLNKDEIEEAIVSAEKKAMRVIAFAHKELDSMRDYSKENEHNKLESEMVFDGVVAIADPIRADVYDAVKSCQSAGVGVKILTGDNIVTASAIADELRLLDNGGIAVEAKEVEEMSDDELSSKLDKISVIARSTPTVKMRVVKLLKAKGEVVAVTGDGINDAPALKNADVGIAMGISGTEVSKEASDIVLVDDSFTTIVKAVEWGRNIYENFKRFISFQLTVNIASVICVFVSVLLGLDAPFTALQLLWINIIMDGPPALTLGLEPNYSDLMSSKPTNRSENIISKEMFVKIFSTGIYMSIVFLCQYRFNFLAAGQNEMRTVLFTLFVLFQLFNAFNCRELHSQTIFKHLFKNKLMLGVVSCTFVLQILIIQFAGAFFGTVPLALNMWLKIFALAFSVVVLSELVKAVIRIAQKIKSKQI